MKRLGLTDKLALNKFEVNEGEAHIVIDQQKCASCLAKNCLFACPAGLYSESNDKIVLEWAGCLECATCLAVCAQGALDWQYPQGGFGINYRYG